MLETMRSFKADLDSVREDNFKPMNAKSQQAEINYLILKILTNKEPYKKYGQNSCSTGKKRKGNEKCYRSEETIDNLHLTTRELKKDDERNYIQQKGKYDELQGEYKKLRPPMFDGEYEEATESQLLNIKCCFKVYRYDDNLRECLAIFELIRKATLWWQEGKRVNNIRSTELRWKILKKIFKKKYMS